MEKITLSITLINQVLGYMGTRPYQEVFQIIEALHSEVQAQPKDTPIEVSVE